MATKTYAELTVATDIDDADLLASYRGTLGPLKSITALLLKNYVAGNFLALAGGTMTGAELFFVGTEALPGGSFAGDPDTGFWWPSANIWALSTGGTERFRISSAGGVFAGALSVGGAATFSSTLGVTGLMTLSGGGNLTPAATPATNALGYLGTPQLVKTGDFTLTMTEAGKEVYWTSDATATIPSNASVALPIGTKIQLDVEAGNTLTIAITTDTLRWIPFNSTGTRTLTGPGSAVISKKTATEWWIIGAGLS